MVLNIFFAFVKALVKTSYYVEYFKSKICSSLLTTFKVENSMFEAVSRAREVWVLRFRRMWPKNCWSETHGQSIGTPLSVSLSCWNQSKLLVLLVRFGKLLFSFNWLHARKSFQWFRRCFPKIILCSRKNQVLWKLNRIEKFWIYFHVFLSRAITSFQTICWTMKIKQNYGLQKHQHCDCGKNVLFTFKFSETKIRMHNFSLIWSKGSFSGSLWCENFCISRASWSVSCNIW